MHMAILLFVKRLECLFYPITFSAEIAHDYCLSNVVIL